MKEWTFSADISYVGSLQEYLDQVQSYFWSDKFSHSYASEHKKKNWNS